MPSAGLLCLRLVPVPAIARADFQRTKPESPISRADLPPDLRLRFRPVQPFLHRVQRDPRVQQPPERPFRQHAPRRPELDILQQVDRQQRSQHEHVENDFGVVLVQQPHPQAQPGAQPRHPVQQQHRPPGGQPARQQPVMDMPPVSSEDRLLPQKPPRDRQRHVHQRHRQQQQRSRHPDQRRRLLAPQDPVTPQQEPQRQAPAVAQVDRRRIIVVPQEPQQRPRHRNRGKRQAPVAIHQRRDEGRAGRHQRQPRRQPVHPVDQVHRIGAPHQPHHRPDDRQPRSEVKPRHARQLDSAHNRQPARHRFARQLLPGLQPPDIVHDPDREHDRHRRHHPPHRRQRVHERAPAAHRHEH